jgi:ParB-like chromosome segregation protein Spo0J
VVREDDRAVLSERLGDSRATVGREDLHLLVVEERVVLEELRRLLVDRLDQAPLGRERGAPGRVGVRRGLGVRPGRVDRVVDPIRRRVDRGGGGADCRVVDDLSPR